MWWWFSHLVVSDSARLLCPWDFPGKKSREVCHFPLQGIFPTQGLILSPTLQMDSLLTELPGKPNPSYSRKRTDLEPGGRVQFSSSSHRDHKACGIPIRESQAQDWQGPKGQVPPQGQLQSQERHSSKDSAALWLESELVKTVEVLSNKGCEHLW